ncbi:leucine-rich repeat domain-containing protein [Coleofasciculus sp.]|uniref:leucine-rich repeat domain-containing protein n=1 Tax=Coleofasciculus sp. TaxID=3100458 RepID=UPI003A433628
MLPIVSTLSFHNAFAYIKSIMPALLYTESPLNPLRIVRHWPDAGLSFEKHRWLFPLLKYPDEPVDIFTFGYHPLREIYIHLTDALSEPSEAIPLANYLTPDALPMPPLHFTLVFEPETDAERLVETLVSNWQAPVYLVFSPAHIPPFEPPPRHTNTLIENILGRPWDGEKNPGWIPLPDAEMRRRAVRALGIKGFHRLYLVAGPPATTALPPYVHQLFKKWNGLTKIDEPEVDYRLFHALVSNCNWLLTSHGNVPGTVPFCFYSAQSFRSVVQDSLLTTSHTLVAFNDIDALNQAAGINVKPRGGLALSEIVPLEMLVGVTELSLSWSDLDRLDELPTLGTLQHLDLDGTLIDDLGSLTMMPQLKSLSLRCLQLTDLQPLTALPSLQNLTLNRITFAGLSDLAAIPALTSLTLDLLPIENAAPLSGCQQLRDISLNRTPLNRLDEIAQIGSLERLSICSTAVTDIKPLIALPNLRELLMDGCALDDLAPLADIKGLTTFSLAGLDEPPLQLPDLSPLAAMQGLKHLYLWNTTFQELPLGSLVSTLETLNISASLAQDLRWLTNLEVLRELEIEQLEVPALDPLMALSSLESLNVCGCKVGDLAWLRNLVQLRTLNLNLTEIADLRPLASLSHLRSLSLAGVYIDSSNKQSGNLDVLSSVSDLEELNVSGWQLGAPRWLASLQQLRVLDISDTDIENTAWLRGIIHLTELNLSRTPLHSLDGLSNSRQLRCLNLNETLISNLNPIRSATELEELSLRNTAINDLSVLGGLKRLKKLDLRGIPNTACDFSPLLELPRLRLLCLDSHGIHDDVLVALKRRHRVVITPT